MQIRKFLLLSFLLMIPLTGVLAESVITLTTAKEYGETMVFSPVPLEKGTIQIDWGDGQLVSYEVDPGDMPYLLRKEHKLLGQTVKIYGSLVELSCTTQQLTAISIQGQGGLKRLSLSDNLLSYGTVNLGDAVHLTMLNLSKNNIGMLNLRNFSELEYLDLYGNPELTTVAFADSNPNLKQITMYDTDVVHFYDEYTFPSLTMLDLHNTSLWDITFTGSHYPKLSTINLNGNQLEDLDVSDLPLLESLSVADNHLKGLNVAANNALTSLNIDGNRDIKKLNLQNNDKLTSLNVSRTGLTQLDVHHMTALRSLYMDSVAVSHVDLSELKWLQTVSAKGGQLSYLDFTANYFNLRYLYLQGNKNFTAQSLNFMYNTIHDPDRNGRIYVEGCTGAEQADPEKYLNLNDASSHWSIDVEGDASASMDSVQLTLLPAQGGTYQVYRRDFAWSLERDNFAKYYELATTGRVIPGFVNVVRFQPDGDNDFLGVKVNGQLISDSLFFVTTDATVEAVFGKAQPDQRAIRFTVKPGITSAYAFAADQPNTPISIDWGDGQLQKATLSNTGWTWFDHQTEGTTVTVYGDVTYVNVESFPDFGTDNQIQAIDLSQNDGLHQLNAYFNQLQSIDVSNQKELVALDVSMNEDIEELDVTHCPLLRQLTAYGTFIEQIDLTQCPQLESVDVKNTFINAIDVTHAPNLLSLNVTNNDLSQLDLSGNPKLQELEASGNDIASVDLSGNKALLSVALSKNRLTSLDLSRNLQLEKLSVSGNQLQQLDLSANKALWYVEVRGNGWDACTVNDFFAAMPQYVSPGDEVEQTTTATKLWIYGESEGTANDVAHAETLLMSDKGWIMNFTDKGDGTGCDHSYVYVLPTENGQVSLTDAAGNTIASGTTVGKGTALTVTATPAPGYAVASIKVNGQEVTGGQFTVTRLTDVAVRFQPDEAAQSKTLYAFTRDYPYAMLSIPANDPTAAKRIGSTDVLVSAGAIVGDAMYVTGIDDDFNTLVYNVNLQTGKLTTLKNLGESAALPVEMSYDYAGETLYFVSNSTSTEGMSALWTMDLKTCRMTKVQDNMGQPIRAIAVNASGDMYGLSRAGTLYSVNKETGKVGPAIGNTGHSPSLFTTMDFDRATGRLYWACYENATHKLYEVSPTNGAVTDLGFIGSGNGLYTVALDMPYVPSEATAPAKIDSLKVIPAEQGVLSATISWQNPTLMANNEPLPSLTKVEVLRDDEVIATLTDAKPGAVMSHTDAQIPVSGTYRYTVRAYNEIGASADRFVDAYVGRDLLAAPERVVAALGAVLGYPSQSNIIAWDAADKGIHGGYVDTRDITYDVIRTNDNVVVAQGIKVEACLDQQLADTLTRYIYKVVPHNADGTGEAKESNYLVNGPAAPVPFTADFDLQHQAQLWTVLDVNQDGYEFIWWRPNFLNGRGVYLYQTHEYNFALDMIVSPPVEFQEGHNYKITVSCCNSFAPYPESFKLYSLPGYTSQGAMPIGEPVENINHPNEFRDYAFELTAEDDGLGASDEKFTSFIGVCCTSNPSMQMFMVSKVTIDDLTPAGISDFTSATSHPAPRTYDLQGRRVVPQRKGLYIINGKKYIK